MPGGSFIAALWIGLSIAAPVGPIGLLVIQRTLRHGRAVGLATGLGAAVADASYGAMGAYGVVALTGLLQGLRVPLVLLGAAFLLRLAWTTWPSHAAPSAAPSAASLGGGPGRLAAYLGTLGLT